ncbi:MAG: hypothetical protein ACOX5G_03595 [Kiritimatiellia bacterium]|jgi:hypothetical protein
MKLPVRCTAFILACASSFAAQTAMLAPGERLEQPFADAPAVSMTDDPANSGGRFIDESGAWRFTDTSEGRVANGAPRFEIRYGPDSAVVAAINEVLARSADAEPEDFTALGTVQRVQSSSRIASLDMTIALDGRDRPRFPILCRPTFLAHMPSYMAGDRISIGESLPHARFRVWPTGGANHIESIAFSAWVRVEANATPETLEVRDFAVARIAKGEGVSDTASANVVLCFDGLPPAPFIGAWRELGLHARVGLEPAEGEAVAAVYASSFALPEREAQRVADHAKSGVPLFLGASFVNGEVAKPLRELLPINTWSLLPRLRRTACEIVTEGIDGAIPFGSRFDFHLPGAPIESPLLAYEPENYLRDPRRFPRTSVLARCANESTLPALLDADVDQTRIVLFAGDFEDALARTSPRYAEWAAAVARIPFGPKAAGDTMDYVAPDAWAKDAAREPFSIAIEEDESTLDELDPAPRPREDVDGILSYRYVYRPDTAPKVRLRLRNHFANIAPLATAADLLWPGNPTASGLNDGSASIASGRDKVPIHAIWAARSAAEQRAVLSWGEPVHIAGVRLTGGGTYRFWSRNNPRDFEILGKAAADAGDGAVLASASEADFAGTCGLRATWERVFDAPSAPVQALELHVTGLDPAARREPNRGFDSNCSLVEWEAWGWAGALAGAKPIARATLEIERRDLASGKVTRRTIDAGELPVCAERVIGLDLEPLGHFGPVRYHFSLREGGTVLATRDFDVFFIPEEGTKLAPTLPGGWPQAGLLCSPGWRSSDSFGLGMGKWTQGWGGAHDKLWAYSLDLMEIGTRNRENPARLFASSTAASHYTNPWRRFPNGEFTWEWVAKAYLGRMMAGDVRFPRDSKGILFSLEDRWNGVNTGTCFSWDVFVDFDRWLRGQGRPGLEGRSRDAIVEEIRTRHGDGWQIFNLRRYADEILLTQGIFEEHGYGMFVRTHGSFPLVGGQLGADLAKTHIGVGTDLFWELFNQDLWWSLGSRMGVIAANPNLQSGAYDEWGWVNSEQNRWWFGSNGDSDVARRQWYATYFLGRVDLDGRFWPYHTSGFTGQGYHGMRYTARDHEIRCRVHNLVTQLRPEEAAGFGIVVSWRGQERRMGKPMGRLSFGIHTADGETDVVDFCRDVYTGLAKQGLPISFVTSTDALKEWKGGTPLLLADPWNWEDWELDAALAAQGRGATLVAIGDSHPTLANPRAEELFAEDRTAKRDAGGLVVYHKAPSTLTALAAAELKSRIDAVTGDPLLVDPGIAVYPFVSQDTLFLSVCREGDEGGTAGIAIKPGFFHGGSSAASRAISLDDGAVLETRRDGDGTLHVALPIPATSGRIVMICRGP